MGKFSADIHIFVSFCSFIEKIVVKQDLGDRVSPFVRGPFKTGQVKFGVFVARNMITYIFLHYH